MKSMPDVPCASSRHDQDNVPGPASVVARTLSPSLASPLSAASSPSAATALCGVQRFAPALVQTSPGASSAAARSKGTEPATGAAAIRIARGWSHGTESVRAAASIATPFVSPASDTAHSSPKRIS